MYRECLTFANLVDETKAFVEAAKAVLESAHIFFHYILDYVVIVIAVERLCTVAALEGVSAFVVHYHLLMRVGCVAWLMGL